MQNFIGIGNVGKDDATLGSTGGGSAVANFSFAVNESYKDKKTNETKTDTVWFKVSAWG